MYCLRSPPFSDKKYHYVAESKDTVTYGMTFFLLLLFIFTQDSLSSAYYTVINEGPTIEVLIVYKAPI